MVNQKKQLQVKNISDYIEKAANIALVKFEKTTHINLEALRKLLKKDQAKIKVVKNTLLEKALNKLVKIHKHLSEIKKDQSVFKNNTAIIALGKDWDKPLHTFYEFIQKEKTISFKIGSLDSQIYNSHDLDRIAQLPGKDQLIIKIISSMKSSPSKLVYAMKYNINKFVYILNQKANIKN